MAGYKATLMYCSNERECSYIMCKLPPHQFPCRHEEEWYDEAVENVSELATKEPDILQSGRPVHPDSSYGV